MIDSATIVQKGMNYSSFRGQCFLGQGAGEREDRYMTIAYNSTERERNCMIL